MAYTLLSGLYDHMTKEQEFNVVLLGMENAGKTVRTPHPFHLPIPNSQFPIEQLVQLVQFRLDAINPSESISIQFTCCPFYLAPRKAP